MIFRSLEPHDRLWTINLLAPDEHSRDSLVLAEQQGDEEEDLLVGVLTQKLVVGGLLNQVQDLGGQDLISQGEGFQVHLLKVNLRLC